MPEAFAMLIEDHRKVERLFEQFEQGGDPDVARQICDELTVHAMLEEELVYPLLSTKVGRGYAEEARNEHTEAKNLITRIENGLRDGEDVSGLVKELAASVRHHVEEEENEIFPTMEETVPKLVAPLGADLVARRAILESQIAEARGAGQPSGSVAYSTHPPTSDVR